VSELVVGGALLGVGQDFVGFLGFLELLLGALVVRIAVRMMLHGQLAIGLLDVVFRGITAYTEDLVVIPFGHPVPAFPEHATGRIERHRPGSMSALSRPVRTSRLVTHE
jgi:hypothetical protein